jgi:hypothetical protein
LRTLARCPIPTYLRGVDAPQDEEALDERGAQGGAGRRPERTPDSVKKNLATVSESLKTASGARRLELIQQRRSLEVELAGMSVGGPDLSALEKDFVKSAKGYSQRKGITYGAWREFGVPAEVLRKAGISRGSS